MASAEELTKQQQELKEKQTKLDALLEGKVENTFPNVPETLRHLPDGYFSNKKTLPKNYEGLSENDKFLAIAKAIEKMSNSGWKRGDYGQE